MLKCLPKKRMKVFKDIINNNKDKVVIIKNQKELDKFINMMTLWNIKLKQN